MAPQADVIVSNVFSTAGSALESEFVKELDRALDLGVDIFNLSITAPTLNNRPLLAFARWLKRAHGHYVRECGWPEGLLRSAVAGRGHAHHALVLLGALQPPRERQQRTIVQRRRRDRQIEDVDAEV